MGGRLKTIAGCCESARNGLSPRRWSYAADVPLYVGRIREATDAYQR